MRTLPDDGELLGFPSPRRGVLEVDELGLVIRGGGDAEECAHAAGLDNSPLRENGYNITFFTVIFVTFIRV